MQLRKNESPMSNAIRRFWNNVDKELNSPCWTWMGKKINRHYSFFYLDGERTSPQKFSWELVHGPIINDDAFIVKSCNNERCVNPEHLRLKTRFTQFWENVDTSNIDECWTWTGPKMKNGYGCFSIHNKNYYTHRLMYEFIHGKIENGKIVCHSCDNPICCNPKHLFIGSMVDNSYDMVSKGRNAKQELHGGSKLTNKQVLEIIKLNEIGERSYIIAKKFNVSQQCISSIINGWNWTELTGRKNKNFYKHFRKHISVYNNV